MKKAMACVFAVIGGLCLLGMSMDNTLEADGGDMIPSNAETYSLWLHDDGDFRINQNSGAINLGDLSTVVDHGALTGLADDDHTQYLNATRHNVSNAHVSGFNNTLPISGDADGKTTQGAHNANGDVHWPRPAQTLTVAQGGTGEYATIAAALAVANANASVNTPYEVAIYPGVYAENNLPVADYVSLRSVVPLVGIIQDASANPLLVIAANSTLDGVALVNVGAGEVIKLTAAASGEVRMIRVSATSTTGVALEFNGTSQNVTIESGCRFLSSGASLISGKTASSKIIARNSTFDFAGSSAIASIINIDNNGGTPGTADIFDSCLFFADNQLAGVTPSSFIDWDANFLNLTNCEFVVGVNAAKTFSNVFAQAGTVSVSGCRFVWVLETGTAYDFNASATATIQHAATVYDVDKTTGAGTISALPEGAALFDAVTMTGALLMAAADSPLINLTPSGTGDSNIISIVPSGALAGANTWRGVYIDGAALDPAAGGASVCGEHIDLSGVGQTQDPTLCGLFIEMPASATTAGEFHAIKLTGNGNELILLNKDYLIDITAATGVPLAATKQSSVNNTVENALLVKKLLTVPALDGAGVSICFHLEDDDAVDNNIATIEAYRVDGLDDAGGMRFSGGGGGATPFLEFEGDGGGVVLPHASGATQGLFFGGASAEIYEDGVGLVINDAGQDPLWIGDTVTVKLGDAAGAESLVLVDSGGAEVFSVDSNGGLFCSQNIFHAGDLDTRIALLGDQMFFDAGGIEMLTLAESAQDEVVINNDGVDVDFRVEAVGTTRALIVDGADGQVTMSQTLTVGDGVAEKILGVTDGTNTAMLGYDGVPHIVITGDSTFIVYSDDTDSDTNLIARADGTGTARVRAQTSGGDYIDINHDGVRGRIDSSLGGIRLSDDAEFNGTIGYTPTGGMQSAGVSVNGNAAATAIAVATTFVQFTEFDTNDASFGLTPDQANDQVLTSQAGIYNVRCSITVDSVGPTAQIFAFELRYNSGASVIGNTKRTRLVAGGGGEPGSVTVDGNVALSAAEDITLWVANNTTTGNILLVDATLTMDLIAGN